MKQEDITRDMNFSAIYKWENKVNGKVYIGQTKNVYKRFRPYDFSNPHFIHAVQYYGLENFDITFIETHLPLDKLDDREEYWINYYDSANQDKGYNIYTTSSPKGHKWSEEARKKHSETMKERHFHFSASSKDKMREAMESQGRCTPVVQIDLKTKKVIATYPSISEAAKQSGCDKSCIIKCLQGKVKKSKGFIFKEVI